MVNSQAPLVTVPENERPHFSQAPIISKHNLAEFPYFDDEALVELLDRFPRKNLRVWMSGDEAGSFEQWQPVDTTGIYGAELFECLKKGRLWVNLQRVDLVDRKFAELSSMAYAGLARQCPHFKVDFIHSYLLLSSPNATVNLHLDSYENFFWCIRGGKKFFLYPPADRRMVSMERMEDICAGADDFFPYRKEYAAFATLYTLAAGDMLSWPQHSPHNIINNDQVNVGLGTFHGTLQGQKRVLNYVASRYFREHFPLFHGDVKHDSIKTTIRREAFRVVRKTTHPRSLKKTEFWAKFKLDGHAPLGVAPISDGPVLAECSRLT